MPTTELEVKSAIKLILEDKKSQASSTNYAIHYCERGLGMHGEELRIQCLYIINNITHWRGAKAAEVRRTLWAFSGGN